MTDDESGVFEFQSEMGVCFRCCRFSLIAFDDGFMCFCEDCLCVKCGRPLSDVSDTHCSRCFEIVDSQASSQSPS